MHTILKELPIESLTRGQYQPRDAFDEESLKELALSITSQGLIEPLVVREKMLNCYEIIAGERRWRAAKMAGLQFVPCLIGQYTDEQAAVVTLIENIQREDLNLLEEAQGYKRLSNEFHFLQEDIAVLVGKSRSHVANILRLLTLSEPVKKRLQERTLSFGHARLLVGMTDTLQNHFVHKIIEEGLSVRALESAIQKYKTKPSVLENKPHCRDVERLQMLLSEQVGAPVQIISDASEGGWLQVQFFNNDTLAGLLEKLGLRYD